MFKTIRENASYEIVEKKSKFIANAFYIESKEEAENLIKQIHKQYHDAKHHCYAYRILEQGSILEKTSDDGEPSGTAGFPMLTILSKNNLTNILVIVTRYFGGILLGTGGLVRAYSKATTMCIERAGIVAKEKRKVYAIEINYTDLNKLKHFAKKNNIIILKEEYSTSVILEVAFSDENILNKISKNEINVKKIQFIKETCL